MLFLPFTRTSTHYEIIRIMGKPDCCKFSLFTRLPLLLKKGGEVTIDMKASTCKDIDELDEESAPFFLIWVDGYLSGVTGDTTFSTKEFKRFVDELGKYCTKNPDSGLLDAAKKVGIQ